jgi:hypothetical protein
VPVSDYDATSITDLYTQSGAVTLRAGAIESFKTIYPYRVFATGLITDELNARPGFGQPSYADLREINPTLNAYDENVYPYSELAAARINLLRAIPAIRFVKSPASWLAQMYAYTGLVELYYEQDMCNGIPLATVSTANGDVGRGSGVVTRTEMLALAFADFDTAAIYAAQSSPVDSATLGLARVGQGREMLENGMFAQAATAVAAVPDAFTDTLDFDGQTDYNVIPFYVGSALDFSMSDYEGQNGLDFVSAGNAGDGRVGSVIAGTDAYGNIYQPTKYPAYTTPIVLANGVEARLIEAEAALQKGDVGTWATKLNALRQTAISPALPPLTVDSTATASSSTRVSVMFRERAFWLYLTGSRQADMRRLIRQYGQQPNAVFPTGPYLYAPGETYGSGVAFAPWGEQSDPYYHGCIDNKA